MVLVETLFSSSVVRRKKTLHVLFTLHVQYHTISDRGPLSAVWLQWFVRDDV